jgi:methyl-accepting chemotaxis protein
MTTGQRARALTHRLLFRMSAATILPAAAVLVAIVAVNAWRKYDSMVADARERLALSAQSMANWVESRNAEGTETARVLAVAQGRLFGRREEASQLVRALLEATPSITGMCTGYEPNADGNDATGTPEGGTGPDGRLLVYWFRDWNRGNALTLKPLTAMEEDYYQVPKRTWERSRTIERVVTEPYDYEGKVMVTYSAPIVVDGEFAGIACADRALEDLQSEVLARADAADSDIFLVSRGGRVVAACDGSGRTYASDPDVWRMRSIDETPLGAVYRRLSEGGRSSVVEELDDPAAGERSFFAIARVPTGDWTLMVSVPSSVVTAPIAADTSWTAGLALAAVGLMAGLLWVPTKRLVRRIDAAAGAAQRVAAGDLTGDPTGSTCPDETGDLLRALDAMTADLNALVGQVQGAGTQLSSTSVELAATARRQEEAVSGFGASTAQIAAAVREIDATGKELAREIDHMNTLATGTAKLANDGRTQLEGMEGAMQSLDTATAGVADRLAAINEKAVNIGGVVTTITKVAEQTNLLSVNAAIEAEKAGEYGRGFLVVAREIRRLADQTGQATLDIERMVKEMQGAVSSGVMEMDRFSEQVRRNVGDVRSIGRSMGEIIDSVDDSTRSFAAVREGMQSQSSGAGQISGAMENLTSNARATGEAVREFGRAADDLQRAIGMLKSAIAAFQLRA